MIIPLQILTELIDMRKSMISLIIMPIDVLIYFLYEISVIISFNIGYEVQLEDLFYVYWQVWSRKKMRKLCFMDAQKQFIELSGK